MINVLIFGYHGMLGNTLSKFLARQGTNVTATTKSQDSHPHIEIINNIDVRNIYTVSELIKKIDPEYVINCVGIIKQKPASHKDMLWINGEFPHLLNYWKSSFGYKLIHISTDCIFDGKTGNHTELDTPTAQDIYGTSKALGEIFTNLVLRTSIIGRELNSHFGLMEWLISNKEKEVQGYTEVLYSGLTTLELSKVIYYIIKSKNNYDRIYNVVSPEYISKYDLLVLINKIYQLNINIHPNESIKQNRTLNPTKFITEIGYVFPTWEQMIVEMYNDEIFRK